MSDRGMKKWAPYKSLKEQWSTLDKIEEEGQEIVKPTMSSEVAEQINDILTNYQGQELIITFYRKKTIMQEKSVIKKIDTFERKLILINRKTILFSELVNLENS